MITKEEFAARRQRFMAAMQANSVAIIAAAPEQLRNGDADYLYRQDSNFYYLTGFPEPDAVAVLIPNRSEGSFILFNRSRNPEMEIWTGKRAGQVGACEIYGADQAYPIDELDARLPELLLNQQHIYYAIGKQAQWDEQVAAWLRKVPAKARSGASVPYELININVILDEMRLFKSPAEIELMRQAAAISAAGHKRAMRACRADQYEYAVEAELLYEFVRQGARAPAYNSIVAGGENACVLHYVDNNAQLREGDLLLIDAAAEYQYYAADITRTFPVNGRFNESQRALYELVLKTQLAVMELIRPGTSWERLQQTAVRMITTGLLELGILPGSPNQVDELIEQQAYKRFYMHNIGHWLGMDVHDVGSYKPDGVWRLLQPGMVLTVEPGIYIAPHSAEVDAKWWGIGIRIEDDVLVTETGYEVLSAGVPKAVSEIEALMQ